MCSTKDNSDSSTGGDVVPTTTYVRMFDIISFGVQQCVCETEYYSTFICV